MRYINNGDYDKGIVIDAKQIYCAETGKPFPDSDFDADFIDWLVKETASIATGRKVKLFLKEAVKIKASNGGNWKEFQIKCVLSTYSNIMIARNWRDFE